MTDESEAHRRGARSVAARPGAASRPTRRASSSACPGRTSRRSAGSATRPRSRRRSRLRARRYISADAQGSNEKQLADVEALITKGAKALIVLAQDADAVLPAVARAKEAGDPGDRLRPPDPGQGRALPHVRQRRGRPHAGARRARGEAQGQLRLHQGLAHRPERRSSCTRASTRCSSPRSTRATIKIVGEQYTEGWAPEVAQKNMEQILTKNDNKVDAVVASNDGTAGGVVAALRAQNMVGVPVSGQDGDIAALNRVALGEQTVTRVEGRARAGQGCRARSRRSWPRARSPPTSRTRQAWSGGAKKIADLLDVPEAGADHAGQPRTSSSTPAGPRRSRCARAWCRRRRRPHASNALTGPMRSWLEKARTSTARFTSLVLRAGGDLDRARGRDRRHLPHAAQPLQPVDPDVRHGDHVVRDGVPHRRAADRSVGRLADGVHRHAHRVRAGAVARAPRRRYAWLVSIAVGVARGQRCWACSRAGGSRIAACRRSS